jgi:hypothetical protein
MPRKQLLNTSRECYRNVTEFNVTELVFFPVNLGNALCRRAEVTVMQMVIIDP